jgi:hypothetical protein
MKIRGLEWRMEGLGLTVNAEGCRIKSLELSREGVGLKVKNTTTHNK